LAIFATGGVLGNEPRSGQWPSWCRFVEKDFSIIVAVRFSVKFEHFCSTPCFDRHQLYFGILASRRSLLKCIVLYLRLRLCNTNYNLKAYKAGKAPRGFPVWPYKHIHAGQTTVMHTIQTKADNLAAALNDQAQEVSSDEESLSNNKYLLDVPYSPSGSSSSD